ERPQAHARLPGARAPRGEAAFRRRDAGGSGGRRHQARRVRVLERSRADPAERDALLPGVPRRAGSADGPAADAGGGATGARRRVLARLRLATAGELLAHQCGAGGQRGELLVAHVAGRPAEAGVGVQGQLLGRTHVEHAPDPRRHLVDRVLVEPLDVDHAGAELAALAVLLPEVDLAELAAGELEDELLGACLQEPREVRRVRAAEARAPEAVAEADVESELGLQALGRHVEEARHLLAGGVAGGGRVGLDEGGPRRDQPAKLGVDDLCEALGDVDDALVDRAGMNPRAEGQRAGAGRLDVARRVRAQVLELLDDAEPAARSLDAADRLVARLLIVSPRDGVAAGGQALACHAV